MRYIYLSLFLISLGCCGTKKVNNEKELPTSGAKSSSDSVILESKEMYQDLLPRAVKDELIVVVKNPNKLNEAKELIKNSGLKWQRMLFDNPTTKIGLIKVPAKKRDFWLTKLQSSGAFKSVELNAIMTTQNLVKREENSFLSIRTTPCFGYCPVYEVTIDKEGNVDYNGLQNVIEKGVKKFQLTEKEFSTLKEKLNNKDFSGFKNKYDDSRLMDLPSTFITYKGKQVEIRLWKDVPDELANVNEYIQDILLAKKYLKK